MILHIDCNSYFASCEIAERPHLANKPVVVSSSNENNGGIILALNGPAKAIGLKRGLPLFQVVDKKMEKGAESFRHKGLLVHCFEVDHEKYHRISDQIMQLVQEQEIVLDFIQYSVDEFFGRLPIEEAEQVRYYAEKVKNLIETNTHIPVSCGCSLTYTLAKVATHFAKKYSGYKGICVLTAEKRERALSLLPIKEVWGLGRKITPKLKNMEIKTALDFANQPMQIIIDNFAIPTLRTWQELNGTSVIKLENKETQQSIAQSRTLPTTTHDLKYLLNLLSSYTSVAARKMREQHCRCKQITVFMNTNRHREDLPQYANQNTVKLVGYEDTDSVLIKAAQKAFREIFRYGYEIKRLGVILENLVDTQSMQLNLFEDPNEEKKRKLQAVIDTINERYSEDIIHQGAYDKPIKKTPRTTR